MKRITKPRVFPVVDSLLAGGLAGLVVAAGATLIRGAATGGDLLAAAMIGLVTATVTLLMAIPRGRGMVDGVFVGPAPRILGLFGVAGCIGVLALVDPPPPPAYEIDPELTEAETAQECALALEAFDEALPHVQQQDAVIVRLQSLAQSVVRNCTDNEQRERVVAATSEALRQRASSSAPPPDPLLSVLATPPSRQSGDDGSIRVEQGGDDVFTVSLPPETEPTVPVTDPPNAGAPPESSEPGQQGESTAGERREVTITREQHIELLGPLFAALGINIGSVRVQTSEVRTALASRDSRAGGEAILQQMSNADLTVRERARALHALLRYSTIGDYLNGTRSEAVYGALTQDPEIGICLLIVAEVRSDDATYDRVRDARTPIITAWQGNGAMGNDARECLLEMFLDNAERTQALTSLAELRSQARR